MGSFDAHQTVTVAVAALTLGGVAFARLPFVPLDRAGFALVGAALLLLTSVLDLREAVASIDAVALVLLFGLMLLNEALADAGAFHTLTRDPGVAPLPYLLALATAASVGSVATVTGNPQNLILSVQGAIGYAPFAVALGPIAVVGMGVVIGTIAIEHRQALTGALRSTTPPESSVLPRRPLVWAIGWAAALLVALLAGAPRGHRRPGRGCRRVA